MGQYGTHIDGSTVDVTNGSQMVTGTNTTFIEELTVGDMFKIVNDPIVYTVGAIVSDTQLTLSANFTGVTDTNLSYVIARDFTPNRKIPLVSIGDRDWPDILNEGLKIIDGLL